MGKNAEKKSAKDYLKQYYYFQNEGRNNLRTNGRFSGAAKVKLTFVFSAKLFFCQSDLTLLRGLEGILQEWHRRVRACGDFVNLKHL